MTTKLSLQEQIRNQLQEAMLAKETVKVGVIRSLIALFTNEMIAKKKQALPDEDIVSLIQRAAKQRKESIDQFTKGGRKDLVKVEEAELKILETYLPKMLDKKEIKKVAEKKMKELKIADKSKAGILMGAVMKELKGKADGTDVKSAIDSLF